MEGLSRAVVYLFSLLSYADVVRKRMAAKGHATACGHRTFLSGPFAIGTLRAHEHNSWRLNAGGSHA